MMLHQSQAKSESWKRFAESTAKSLMHRLCAPKLIKARDKEEPRSDFGSLPHNLAVGSQDVCRLNLKYGATGLRSRGEGSCRDMRKS